MKRQRQRMIGKAPRYRQRGARKIRKCRLLMAAPAPPMSALDAGARQGPGDRSRRRAAQFYITGRARPALAESRHDGQVRNGRQCCGVILRKAHRFLSAIKNF